MEPALSHTANQPLHQVCYCNA